MELFISGFRGILRSCQLLCLSSCPFLNVCADGCACFVYTWVHMCGGQKPTSGIVPQELPTLVF